MIIDFPTSYPKPTKLAMESVHKVMLVTLSDHYVITNPFFVSRHYKEKLRSTRVVQIEQWNIQGVEMQ